MTPQFIVIFGPFGSGTSVMAQVLHCWGVHFPEPHFHPADERTPNSFESHQLRDVLLRHLDEWRLRRIEPESPALVEALERLRGQWLQKTQSALIGLKHPLLCLCVAEAIAVFQPRVIYCQRGLEAIESSRQRRGWPPRFGAQGARTLSAAFEAQAAAQPFSCWRHNYADWRDPDPVLRSLATFCDLAPSATQWTAARALIRPAQGTSRG